MRKQVLIPALLALSVGLAACSHQPNVNLEQARTNYSALQSNPKATELAALETKDASEWLDKADAAYRNNDDQKKVDQLAYLTNQRVELAKQTINLKTAENDLKNASAQRAQARLDARDAQIKALQNSLNAKQTERGTLVTFGDVLFDLNKSELKSAGLVNVKVEGTRRRVSLRRDAIDALFPGFFAMVISNALNMPVVANYDASLSNDVSDLPRL